MNNIKKILCPYDFSEHADSALQMAVRIANSEVEITLLNVIQMFYMDDSSGFTYYEMKLEEIKSKTEDSFVKKLGDLKKIYPKINIKYQIEIGNDPAELIIETQRNGNFDLIVMGSHGRKGIGRILMGSVAESVMRDTKCPVLIIKK